MQRWIIPADRKALPFEVLELFFLPLRARWLQTSA